MTKPSATFDLNTLHQAVTWKLLKPLGGRSFCQTGSMSISRAQMDQLITVCGGSLHSVIKSSTNYLIVPNGPEFRKGSKYKAALDQGVTVITEDEFCGMILPTEKELRAM